MKKLYLYALGLAMGQFVPTVMNAQTSGTVTIRSFEDDIAFGGCFWGVSPNGQYAVGFSEMFTGNSFIWDRETDELKLIEGSYENQSCAYGVSDDGTVVGSFLDENSLSRYGEPCMVPGFWKDGVWTALERLEGVTLSGQGLDGDAKKISRDGRIIGGYLKRADYKYFPCIWVDGVMQPGATDELRGQGGILWSMSDDGTLLGGRAEHESGAGSPALWSEGQTIRLAGEVWDEETEEYFFQGSTSSISRNGEYAAGLFSYDGGMAQQPFIWSKENGFKYIAENGSCTHINDEGMAFGVDGYMGSPFIYKNGTMENLTDYLKSEYEYNSSDYIQYVLDASDNSRVMGGWTMHTVPMGTIMKPVLAIINVDDKIASSKADYGVNVRVEGNTLFVTGKGDIAYSDVKVYDSVGACVAELPVGKESVEIPQSGAYIVRISGNQGISAHKIMIP